MQIVEFGAGTLRFLDQVPQRAPEGGFVWIYLERESLEQELPAVQRAAQALGGSPVLDLHVKDLANRAHPSYYDYTSIYDIVTFRRLATEAEVLAELGEAASEKRSGQRLGAFSRIRTRAVSFVVFDRLLITVHPAGCFAARSFIERYLSDAVQAEGLNAAARSRLPISSADLMLRMLNVMVDNYLDLRKVLGTEMDQWQQSLLGPDSRAADWAALMTARNALHTLEDLCEEQNDAMQEWLDTQREQPAPWMQQVERDSLLARARDVVEHIQRVVHHLRRMEQGAETAVQIHFSAQSNRTNETMRTLTALTAIFLPLNLIAGIFGMNFDVLPLTKLASGFWWTLGAMALIAAVLALVFRHKRYLARGGR
ncbi:magnesium transporter CorA family protein [Caenimonas sedimenti]|uniref:Magnesium transporter CorA family protein n=1 Tax=Caenimonas sedimenti TaxID=2596921 RepID=A0A562ZIB4_9BURK|nr:magnesium transporter CorA family protein [Caenimonas sedimenti]TWO68233.1 magnesium transporter CorA family protein [Caenimonas sedimenti]